MLFVTFIQNYNFHLNSIHLFKLIYFANQQLLIFKFEKMWHFSMLQ